MSGAVNAIRKNTAAPTMPKIASSSNRPRSASSVTVGSKGHHGSGSGVGGSSSRAGGGAGGGGGLNPVVGAPVYAHALEGYFPPVREEGYFPPFVGGGQGGGAGGVGAGGNGGGGRGYGEKRRE